VPKIIHSFHIVFAFVCVAWSGPNAAAEASPTEQIRSVVDAVLALLQDAHLQPDARRKGIRDAVAPHFDYRAMSQSTLALSWKKATPEQQDRFVELFPKMLENVYIVAMEEYSGETVKYGKEKIQGKRASVETYIVQPNGPEIPIVYRMRLKNDRWLAYDVVIEGVSLVSNYRSSFRRIADVEGMEALLEQLQEKVDSQLKNDA
jgi:phospholipid transport system substrate-binding protein